MNKLSPMLKRSGIEASKFFPRLTETTQVAFPKNGQEEIISTRFKHSYEVETSALMIVETINYAELNVDYQGSVALSCLLHDVGHSPFGHEGAQILDFWVRKKGLKEGFSDNSNNFTVIEKAQLNLEAYDLASLIKYPDKLYGSQKDKYLKYLSDSIDEDIEYFSSKIKITKRPKRTIACEIMDEADRNTYVCSDLADCFCLGLGKVKPFKKLYKKGNFTSFKVKELLTLIIAAIKTGEKTLIKRAFCQVKDSFNQNYLLGDNLELIYVDKELFKLRELLYSIEVDMYIDSKKILKERKDCKKYLTFYMNAVDKGYCPSKTYGKKLKKAKSKEEILVLKRDMIAEATDWFVRNYYRKNKKKS